MNTVTVESATPAEKDANVRKIVGVVGANGKFFTTMFIKRDGTELRAMPCRLGVKVLLKGGELKYDPKSKNLIGVYDAGDGGSGKGYKMIPTEGVKTIKSGDVAYQFVDSF